ncbi:MAG: AAA family ATPase [Deltaproteobacteria bacterium]|nr:AAA family ATPase [Deltaproteobacteria bacterium]
MEEPDLLAVAADWSHWHAPPPPSVPRSIALPAELRPDLALVVLGVRRCGKSTLLTQLMGRYGVNPERCLFANFEDPRLAHALDHTTLETLVDAFERTHGEGATYFLDEIQAVTGWQRWFRAQLDRPRGRRFVVTGSNSHLLSGEIASSLTGRHFVVELFPFDFDEVRSDRFGTCCVGADTELADGTS